MRRTRSRSLRPCSRLAALAPGVVCLAVLTQTGCSGGDQDPSSTATTDVEVCVDQEATEDGAAVVEVRQDGEVVGTVSLGSGGTAGVQVPPGPVEAYVDGVLVGSGELGEGGSISFPCLPASSTGAPTSEPMTPSATSEPAEAATATPG